MDPNWRGSTNSWFDTAQLQGSQLGLSTVLTFLCALSTVVPEM